MTYRARIITVFGTVFLGGVIGASMIRARWEPSSASSAVNAYARLCAAPPGSMSGVAGILRHNITVCLSLVLAPLTFGVRLVSQSIRIGWDASVAYGAALSVTQSKAFAIGGLAPHGILEIPAFVGVGATSLGGVVLIVQCIRRREGSEWMRGVRSLARELPIPLAMLLLAAFVEEFVTTQLLRWMARC